MFFFMTTKENDSVTPHVSFDKNDSVTPYVLIDKDRQCLFSWRPKKNHSVTPYVLFDNYRQWFVFAGIRPWAV